LKKGGKSFFFCEWKGLDLEAMDFSDVQLLVNCERSFAGLESKLAVMVEIRTMKTTLL
jgi:hypothetical protein